MENCILPKYISNDKKKNFSPETKRYYKQKKYNLSNSKKRTTLLHLTALKIGFFSRNEAKNNTYVELRSIFKILFCLDF